MSDYTVTVRGTVPPDLAQRIAEAHAVAIQKEPTNTVNAPAGKKVRHSVRTIRRDSRLF